MGVCYIVSYKVYSERAGQKYGHPYVWKGHVKFRGRIPSDRRSFYVWLKNVFASEPIRAGTFKVLRHQCLGESSGCKCVAYGTFDFDEGYVNILRFTEKSSGDEHKVVPNVSWSREPYWQSERHGFGRTRFKGTGGRFGKVQKPEGAYSNG